MKIRNVTTIKMRWSIKCSGKTHWCVCLLSIKLTWWHFPWLRFTFLESVYMPKEWEHHFTNLLDYNQNDKRLVYRWPTIITYFLFLIMYIMLYGPCAQHWHASCAYIWNCRKMNVWYRGWTCCGKLEKKQQKILLHKEWPEENPRVN